ncbi:ferroxidase fet3, partial [Blyttiomyces sp. JEL0837]
MAGRTIPLLTLGLSLFSFISSLVHAETVNYKWSIGYVDGNFDGVPRTSIGVNGQPGHETAINVTMGDRVIVEVTNNLDVPISIHFHGIYQTRTNEMDGAAGATQCPITPGRNFVYNFTVAGQEGTYWWHAHNGALYADGLRGPFIIHGPSDAKLSYDHDLTVQLTDWYHETSTVLVSNFLSPLQAYPMFSSGLINGRGQFNCTTAKLKNPKARRGRNRISGRRGINGHMNAMAQSSVSMGIVTNENSCTWLSPTVFSVVPMSVYRLRLINTAAFAAFVFSIDGHRLTVVEVDGVYVTPHVVDNVPINAGQRYSVLVTTNAPIANYTMRSAIRTGGTWTPAPEKGFISTAVALWSYKPINKTTTHQTKSKVYSRHVTLLESDLHPIDAQSPPKLTSSDLNLIADFEFNQRSADLYTKAYFEIRPYGTPRGTPLKSLRKDFRREVPKSNEEDQLSNSELESDLIFPDVDSSPSDTWGQSYVPPKQATLYALSHLKTPLANLPATTNVVPVSVGQVVQFTIVNYDPAEHPFHIHGVRVWLMATGVAKSFADVPTQFSNGNPLRRDVINVPPCPSEDSGCLQSPTNKSELQFGYTVIRFVGEEAGVFPFH